MPYRRWVDEGWIEATPGNVIDHDEIKAAIIVRRQARSSSRASPSIHGTPRSSRVELNEAGVEALEFVQGIRTYTAPTKELLALLADRKLDHGDNPVLTVMASNLKVQRDKNLNGMPHKAQQHRAHRRHDRADHGHRSPHDC